MLNDSKEIAATLYLSSGILAVVIIVSLAIPKYLNVYGTCYAVGIPTASTVVLLVVFVSKVGLVTGADLSEPQVHAPRHNYDVTYNFGSRNVDVKECSATIITADFTSSMCS